MIIPAPPLSPPPVLAEGWLSSSVAATTMKSKIGSTPSSAVWRLRLLLVDPPRSLMLRATLLASAAQAEPSVSPTAS